MDLLLALGLIAAVAVIVTVLLYGACRVSGECSKAEEFREAFIKGRK